jgi:hypothetical protein
LKVEGLVLQHLRKVSDKYVALSRQLLPYYVYEKLLHLILVHQTIKQNKDFPRPLKIRRNIVLQKQQWLNTYLNKPFTAKICAGMMLAGVKRFPLRASRRLFNPIISND